MKSKLTSLSAKTTIVFREKHQGFDAMIGSAPSSLAVSSRSKVLHASGPGGFIFCWTIKVSA
jgi:hypothetical protein